MNERVVEILVYIMNEMQGEPAAPGHMEMISRDLLQRGYTENEISSAFSWLYERHQYENEELVRHTGPTLSGTFRVLHDLERLVISPEGHGYLLQLKHLGILDDAKIEQVIERAMMIGSTHLPAEAIKALVASSLGHADGMNDEALFMLENNAVVH